MLQIKIEKSFKKDVERDRKSGVFSTKDFTLLKEIITDLQEGKEIDQKYKRHPLSGKMGSIESIHIKFDWLLIIKIDEQYLNLIMLGKHTQVYKKFK